MKLFPFFLLFSIFVSGQKSKNTDTTYYFPAEWEPHRGMIVSFDNETRADSVSVNMVKAVCCNTKVYCVIAADSLIPYYKSWFQKENLSLDSIRFILFGLSQPSIRDPIFFLKNDRRDLKIMDFRWVDYGYQPDSAGLKNFLQWNAKDRKLFKDNFLATFPFSTEQSDMVAEGGSIEVNGKGVLLQVESVNMHRNPTLTKEIQEKELKKYLGISKVIWLKIGPADDGQGDNIITANYIGMGGAWGHVDEFCRFANAGTLFLTYPDVLDTLNNPVSKITFERMKINYGILEKATDQDGNHFKIVKIPEPDFDPIRYILDSASIDKRTRNYSKYFIDNYHFKNYDTCYTVPASSYLNYLVTNHKILIPKYWREGKPLSMKEKDERVRKIFEKYFPDREIVQIDPRGLNYRGGGIHCWSQQIPY